MKITDKDRELAAELVELLTGAPNDRDARCVAVILAAHRSPEQGRCGDPAPVLFGGVATVSCDLAAGHLGWHRSHDADRSRPTEWSA